MTAITATIRWLFRTPALLRCCLIAAACSLPSGSLHAQSFPIGGHYVGGTSGLDAAAHPPGFYLRDFNYFYSASKVEGLPVHVDGFFYAQAPRLIYIAPAKILGANYGAHVTFPLIYKSINTPVISDSRFGLGDIQINPIQLMWDLKPVEFALGYGMFVPSGDFDASNLLKQLTSPGKGFWSHMFIARAAWQIDEDEKWSLSLASHYEMSQEQDRTHITPGDALTLEWGIGRALAPWLQAGITGYYQQQLTRDSGPRASRAFSDVLGIGPEITARWPSHGWALTARYAYEAEAANRPQGHLGLLILTKRF